MSTTVTFFKSDAMHDAFPAESDEMTIQLPENAQLTYTELRDTRSGDPIAYFSSTSEWVHKATGTHWSDVVIGNER